MVADYRLSKPPRPWTSDRTGVECEFYLGEGASSLEIVVAEQDGRPTKQRLQRLYKDRRDGRANPILVVVLYDDGTVADVCGPAGEEPPVKRGLDPGQVQRICNTALNKPNRNAAQRFLRDILDQIDDDLVGLRNQGLLSTHELKEGVPERDDWNEAAEQARGILDKDSRDLIEELGYEIERLSDQSHVLKDVSDGRETAVAVFLQDDESFDYAQDRFTGQSPVSYALNEADKKNLDYVIANSNNTLRLYTTNPDAGFGSRGRTDTFVEVNTDLLTEDDAGYLWLLFSTEALSDDGTLHNIMEDSKDYAASLGERLRERIYDDVIPDLAEAIANARELEDPTKDELDETYRMALILLYRLLFISYAEDEGFLPRYNPRYERRSLKQKAHEVHEIVEEDIGFDERSTTHWDDVMALSRAIHNGHAEWGLPEYDGTLLASDEDASPAGAKLDSIRLTDEQFGPVLANLLVDETQDGYQGPVDFRNIGVREFGVIYEGLLESELSVADQPLGVDDEGRYEPVDPDTREVIVEEDEVYLHGQSGERKATGTYYTKTRFVEHLLDYSLEPALDEHLERLDELSDNEAAEQFFDIRVADISMGSGHFLVGAVDRIESRLSAYLSERTLPRVEEELDRLREKAENAFESEQAMPEVERGQLLRRQVARRCIYGVDLNPLATELARLSIWVHTFVPGLPLTFLDYNLVTGDSLAGIGTLDEVSEILDLDQQKSLSAFMPGGSDVMDDLRTDIDRIGRLADADASEVREARETREEIEQSLEQTQAAFDILAASRIDDDINPSVVTQGDVDLTETRSYELMEDVLGATDPLHFPAAFPEVFEGDSRGFDVIVGNPPWEEATLEEDEFWMRYAPGLMGKSQTEQEQEKERLRTERPDLVKQYKVELEEQEKVREILRNGPYPGMGTGDPDMYKAFYWRFWNLVSSGGDVGVVLPRSAFIAAGSEEFRRTLLNEGKVTDLTFVKNKDGWVFDNMEHRYTIALLGFEKTEPDDDTMLPLRGPYPDLQSYQEGLERGPYQFPIEQAKNWTGSAAFPLFPSKPASVEAFKQLTTQPPLDRDEPDEWRARPNTELHATNDKTADETRLMHFVDDPPEDYWPIFKGASIAPPNEDLWINDTGVRYAWANPDVLVDFLDERRRSKSQHWASPFYEMDDEWVQDRSTLPCLNPRLAFRDIARSTDQRTVRPALVPPNVFLTNKAPYFLWPRGNSKDEAFLLGVLASRPLDWYARRFVEVNLNFHILNAFPVPRPERDSQLWQRVVSLSGRIAAKDERYKDWAEDVGVEYGPLDEDDELEKIHEIDAVVAHLYGLSREHLQIIFETFHEGWDYEPRLNAVLEYYDDWDNKLDQQEAEVTDD